MSRIGILAYGSLIEDPGVELDSLIISRIGGVETPFNIEFARSSRTRDGAPTVVPVIGFGTPVKGVILILDEKVEIEVAKDLLWRRETRNEGTDRHYRHSIRQASNQMAVAEVQDFHGVDHVLYTSIGANITNPTPSTLAHLAIESAAGSSGAQGRDGISYLISLKNQNIQTPLMEEYEAEILRVLDASSLQQALPRARTLAPDEQAPTTRS